MPDGQPRGGARSQRSSRPARRPARRPATQPAQAERDLALALRAELAAVEPPRLCCRTAERAGLGAAALGRARSPAVARLAVRLGPGGRSDSFEWQRAPGHCRIAYLRGFFLAHGSLSLGAGRTHLEFVVDVEGAPVLAAWLAELGLPGTWRVRRGKGVVTWKSSERVSRFLRAAGAGSALLELEARGVTRALHGELNRLSNADAANLERSVRASARQIAAIDRLTAEGGLGDERALVLSVAAARRRAPEATLDELAQDVGCTRSAVQRALQRIVLLAGPDARSPTLHSARYEGDGSRS